MATGEAVAVVDDVVTWTTKEKVEVGEVQYTNSDGGNGGSAKVYQTQDKVHSLKIWYPVQARQQLSDEEFFNITGDQDGLARTLALRAKGEKRQKHGRYIAAGGALSVIGGLVLSYGVGNPLGMLFTYGGGAAIVGGMYYSMTGAKMMSRDSHAVDRSEAERAAQNYNANIGRTVGIAGKF